MSHWMTLTRDNLSEVLNEEEWNDLERAGNQTTPARDVTDAIIRRVSAEVREAVMNNPRNSWDPAPYSVPETLVNVSLDLIACRLLKRFDLELSDARKDACDKARLKLEDIASGKWAIADPDGTLLVSEADRPSIISPVPGYGNDGIGLYPVPDAWTTAPLPPRYIP